MAKSNLEATFDYYWRVLNGPPLTPEYKFYENRKWRFDRVHISTLIAIELDGGTWVSGRHSRGKGYSNDCEKLNRAALLGWRVFRLTSDMLQSDPQKYIGQIIEFINNEIANGNTWVNIDIEDL